MKGLYIHIPFCIKKCDYCDFLSFSCCDKYFFDYIDALIYEMDGYRGESVDTVFIGGGTPSVLPSALTEKLCRAIAERFELSDGVEWTTEANPGTLDDEKIYKMRECGINRVSVGVQSFNDNELKAVGRIHNAETAYNTVLDIKRAGFSNISIDLMESLPHQTAQSFKKSLETAVSLPITHISVYSLIIEEGTPIKAKYDSGIYTEPCEDNDRDLYKWTGEYLKKHGFLRYEISNYAKQGFESRHNLKYWDCDEYIGVGLGAHSYINRVRFRNTTNLSDYIKGENAHFDSEVLSERDMMGEFMMLGLRKIKGINRDIFSDRFGLYPEAVYGDTLEKFISLGLMITNGENYALTEKGLDLSNTVMCEFL